MGLLRTSTVLGCTILSGMAALSLTAACGSEQGGGSRTVRGAAAQVPAADPRPYADADAAFGLDVLKSWCGEDKAANVVFSPSSLSSGLGMVHLGARGRTAAAMARTLRLPAGDPLPGLHARGRSFEGLGGKDVTFTTSDQVWSDERVTPGKAYLDRVATAYDASLELLDIAGDPDGARKTINSAVKKTTGGKIPSLLPKDSITKETGWVLTDAVYLKADWATPFKKSATGPEPFTTAAGKRIQADMMSRAGMFGHAEAGGWTAVDLPYKGGRLGMTALLPDDAGSTGCPELSAATLRKVTSALRPARLDLHLPKIDLKSNEDMKPLLTRLGMGVAFGDQADLTGLSAHADKIQFVRHAATLRVDEKGTEAAAATGTGIGVTSAPPAAEKKIVFDRPYLVLVRDTRTGQPLFLARVADPSAS
ncbi:serpin family protein [Spirillospora sp. NPDC047279]|uniref:serpin family protein n=1 Tax=Spirillospora sp. NPDC047279 TaxID=3155478 RepID=UPI0033E1EAAD